MLAAGTTDVTTVFVSMSARSVDGRDADYIEWHSLDHRPEQYRLPGLRNSQRLVSTPACRAARAADGDRFTAVDHVMSYFFAGDAALGPFAALGAALRLGGRMPLRLPSVELAVLDLAGMVAAPRVVAGADVVPWRPGSGVYLLVEQGAVTPAPLVGTPGVAGAWWFDGCEGPAPFDTDHRGLRLTFLFLDGDPVEVAERLRDPLERRWTESGERALLAAPFQTVVPSEWDRHLP